MCAGGPRLNNNISYFRITVSIVQYGSGNVVNYSVIWHSACYYNVKHNSTVTAQRSGRYGYASKEAITTTIYVYV